MSKIIKTFRQLIHKTLICSIVCFSVIFSTIVKADDQMLTKPESSDGTLLQIEDFRGVSEYKNIILRGEELYPGMKRQLYAQVINNFGNYPITWESSDTKVVSISNSGLIEALSPGEATITARINNSVSSYSVVVSDSESLKGKVKSYTDDSFPASYITERYNTIGQIRKYEKKWDNGDVVIVYKYNKLGYITSVTEKKNSLESSDHYPQGNESRHFSVYYNEDMSVKTIKDFDYDGNLVNKIRYLYDENGLLKYCKVYGDIDYEATHLIKKIKKYYDHDGILNKEKITEYDSLGQKIRTYWIHY